MSGDASAWAFKRDVCAYAIHARIKKSGGETGGPDPR